VAAAGDTLPDPVDVDKPIADYLNMATGSHYRVKITTSKEVAPDEWQNDQPHPC